MREKLSQARIPGFVTVLPISNQNTPAKIFPSLELATPDLVKGLTLQVLGVETPSMLSLARGQGDAILVLQTRFKQEKRHLTALLVTIIDHRSKIIRTFMVALTPAALMLF